jgi:peptidoglycan lytic transglycosylase
VRVNDRGPYARNRIIDLSIGTAEALDFYGHGLAHVRVEYVGPAPIAGSDDRMLLATLREGSPAPAPSKVMVASAQPFLSAGSPGIRDTPLPMERPFTLGASSSARVAAGPPASEITSVTRSPARSVMRSPAPQIAAPQVAESRTDPPTPWVSAPSIGFAPAGGGLGLMSGRGLY